MLSWVAMERIYQHEILPNPKLRKEAGERPLRIDAKRQSVSNLFRKLNLPKPKVASLHLLRHSHASHLLASGLELPVVSERLGHSSVFVTATVYSHCVTGRDKEAAKKWDEFQKLHELPRKEQ